MIGPAPIEDGEAIVALITLIVVQFADLRVVARPFAEVYRVLTGLWRRRA